MKQSLSTLWLKAPTPRRRFIHRSTIASPRGRNKAPAGSRGLVRQLLPDTHQSEADCRRCLSTHGRREQNRKERTYFLQGCAPRCIDYPTLHCCAQPPGRRCRFLAHCNRPEVTGRGKGNPLRSTAYTPHPAAPPIDTAYFPVQYGSGWAFSSATIGT